MANKSFEPIFFTPPRVRGMPWRLYKDAPEAPDYGPIAQANKESAKIMAEQADKDLQFRMEQYADLLPFLRNQLDIGTRQAALQEQVAAENAAWATSERERQAGLFQPVEEQMASEALEYGTEGDQIQAATRAGAAVDQQFDQARDAEDRNLKAMGVDPSSGRYTSSRRGMALAQAGARAAAMTAARQTAKDKGIALRAGTANFGRGLGNTAATAYNTAVGAGATGAQTAGAGVGSTLAGANYVSGGTNNVLAAQQAGINANMGMANLMQQDYANQVTAANGSNSALGGFLGTAGALVMKYGPAIASAMSSKKLKTDKAPVKAGAALAAVRKMPVGTWRYKPGVEDEGEHIGPYAEDVQAAAGDAVAPGGEKIDLVSMNGLTLAAVRDLDREVQKLKGARR